MDPQVRFDACPDEEVLRAFLLGDLPEPVIDALLRHQEECPACESRAEALDNQTDLVLDELRRSIASASRPGAGDDGPSPPGDVSAPAPAPPVLPEYEIEGPPIGVGATGLIYKASHRKLGRVAALKMIARRPDLVSRLFEIEAKAVARLQHPNIVQIYDIGRHEDRPFLALEFVDGGSLEDRLSGALQPPRAAADTIRIAAEAVDHAHRHGIVHCDLKPSNILITRDGIPKIADFGVAKWTESDGYWDDEGVFPGTPRYMAPEQAGGDGTVGPATDVYSLGVILYEMLTGHVPHPAATAAEALRMIREHEPTSPCRDRPDVPRDLSIIALKCLRRRPEDRYAGARELADDLSRFLAGEPVEARESGLLERAWTSARPRMATMVALPMAAAATFLLIAHWVSQVPTSDLRTSVAEADKKSSPVTRVIVQDDGSFRLGAASAVVSGGSLRFEDSFGNLGFWHGEDDSATWTFQLDRPGTYWLVLEYSNRNGKARNRYEVRLDDKTFVQMALGTDGWSDYRKFRIGDARLDRGLHTLVIRPSGPLDYALFDLRAVILEPAAKAIEE